MREIGNLVMTARYNDPLVGEIPERVQLTNAPLVRVLGQITFPRIAKIVEESYIADFQEAIRGKYPHFQSDTVQGLDIVLGGSQIQHRPITTVIWRFFDSERILRVSLTPDAITLETAKYVSRVDFLDRFKFILTKLNETIRPDLIQRVGFRYVDRIEKESDMEKLSNLIRPEMLNVARSSLMKNIDISMTEMSGTTSEGKLIAKYGLAPAGYSHDPEMAPAVNKKSWVLDVDSSSSSCEGDIFDPEILCDELDKVAARAYAFFRWSITEDFLEHFGSGEI